MDWMPSIFMDDAVPLALLDLLTFFEVFLTLSLLTVCAGFVT
jgi:hypothetical protein